MRRSYYSLIGGVVLAIIAIVLMNLYVGRHTSKRVEDKGYAQIAVAAADLPAGLTLRPWHVRFARWPAESVPQGAFTTPEAIFKNVRAPSDRVVLSAMVRGEPVLRNKISGMGARPILSWMVADEMRAISIQINDVSGVSGFILPGDRVDVLLTRHLRSGSRNLVTDIILQNIKVLGINQLTDQKTDKPVVGRTATVEVTPEQASKLVLAQQAGTLSLALRNPAAAENVSVSPVGESDLGTGRKVQTRRPDSSGVAVRVRYGNEESRTR